MKKGERRWNLNDVLPVNKFDSQYKQIEHGIKQFKKHFKTLSPTMSLAQFKKFLLFDEKLTIQFEKLASLPGLWETTDQNSSKAKLFKSRVENLGLVYNQESRAIWHWIKGKEVAGKKRLDDKNAKRLFKAVPELEYSLTRTREAARYTLSQKEERIITEKDMVGVGVLTDLRDLIATEFTYEFKPKGAKKPKTFATQSELMIYVHSKHATERAGCYKALFSVFKKNLQKFFMVYQSVVKNWGNMVKLRDFKSAIAVRNHRNDVPDKAIEVLLEVCKKNRAVFQRFFKYKAKQLGMKKLRRFDIYAPLPTTKEKKIPFEKSVPLVLNTLKDFHEGFYKRAKMILDEKHVDSHPRPEKRGGAFCWTVSPDVTPYVLLNHTGKMRDVSTLAHELGHGVHSLYANHHFASTQHAGLPLAETASTFSEMILFEKLFSEAKDDKTRKAMLADKMADSYATVMRQCYFVIFEIAAHEAIQKGVTAEQLSDIYFKTLKEQFGNSIELDPMFRYEWSYIPHIVHTPFYCYSYNFGELLSLALYARYKKEGKAFIPKIEKILSYGGSADPVKVLKEVGIDMTSAQFWQGSFDIIKQWQRELEKYA